MHSISQRYKPTESGAMMMASITVLLKDRNTMLQCAEEVNNRSVSETVSIRYTNTMFSSFVLPFLEKKKYRNILLDIRCDELENIISKVSSDETNAGFVALNSSLDSRIKGLVYKPVCATKMVLVCDKNNPLTKKDVITAEDLKNQPFCLYNDSFHDLIFEHLQFLCGPLKLVLRVDDSWAMHEAVTRLHAVCFGRIAQGSLSRDSIMNDLVLKNIGNLIDENATLGRLTNPHRQMSVLCRSLLNDISQDIEKRCRP